MATNFGISELRSRFDDWRTARRKCDADNDGGEPNVREFEIVEDSNRSLDLTHLLESVVIPRLVASRTDGASRVREPTRTVDFAGTAAPPIDDRDVERFAALAVDGEAPALLTLVESYIAAGLSVETVFVDLLAPAARLLGKGWEDDSRDFVEVTMGLWRMQEVLRETNMRYPPKAGAGQGRRAALFSPMPGDQHSLGAMMVSECFQRSGWDTQALVEPTHGELVEALSGTAFELVGLTVSNDCTRAALVDLVRTIRSVSRNPDISILLGGRMVNVEPDLADRCGADGTAADATAAVMLADRLVPLKMSLPDLPI